MAHHFPVPRILTDFLGLLLLNFLSRDLVAQSCPLIPRSGGSSLFVVVFFIAIVIIVTVAIFTVVVIKAVVFAVAVAVVAAVAAMAAVITKVD